MKRKQNWLIYIPYVVAMVLLILASFYDYAIAQILYQPTSLIGIFFERIVLVFIIFLLPFGFYGLYRVHENKLYFCLYLLCIIYWVLNTAHYWISLSSYVSYLLASILFIIVLCTIVLRFIPTSFFQRYERFFIFVLCVFLSAMAITFVCKTMWGRVRYREMLEDVSQFTAWYLPQGMNGHSSFPSGHTTAMSSILCFLEIHRVKSYKMHRNKVLCVFIFCLIIMMMYARMRMGAHFLSDVTMGFTITYTVYLFWKRRIYREDIQ